MTDDEVRITLPGSAVVTYATQAERDRAVRLAAARQRIAHEGALLPAWDALNNYEQEMAALEARNWLHAAEQAGLAPTATEFPLVLDALDVAADAKREHAELCNRSGECSLRPPGDRCPACVSRLGTAHGYEQVADRLRGVEG